MKTFGYIATFLGGAIAGAAIGLLLAPKKVWTRAQRLLTRWMTSARSTTSSSTATMPTTSDDIKEAVDADKA